MLGGLIDRARLFRWRRQQMSSLPLRAFFAERYGIQVGLYSYGCFDRWRMPGPLRIGRYCSFGNSVRVVDSKAILIYGAGLYSFFNNYELDCSNAGAAACQKRVLSIENSGVSVYNLNGVGVTNLVTVDNVDVASAADGPNGYVQTVALFRTSEKLLL